MTFGVIWVSAHLTKFIQEVLYEILDLITNLDKVIVGEVRIANYFSYIYLY